MNSSTIQNSKFVEKFTIIAAKLGNEIHLRSLRDAFSTLMPLYILAGCAVLVNNTIFSWFLEGETLKNAQYWGTLLTNATLNINALLVAPVIGYFLSQNKGFHNPLAASIISLSSLIITIPNFIEVTPLNSKELITVSGILSFNEIGTQGMFAGVIMGLIATELFIWISNLKKLQINLGDNIPPAVSKSFNVLIPIILLMSFLALISAILFNVFNTNLISLITSLIQEPLRLISTSLIGCIILYSLGNFLWILGIHQSVIYGSLLGPLLLINITQNMAAYAANEPIPNILTDSLVPNFGMMGGSGSTICLLIATFIVGRNIATKSVSKMAFIPGIFNINEPVIFGYPIVYNISMLIPFIFVPAFGIFVAYMATAIGFMDRTVVYVPWTTPPLLNGYLSTAGDWHAIIVQAFILIVGVLVYIPFVKINDNVLQQQNNLK